jgi:hypothetical protein
MHFNPTFCQSLLRLTENLVYLGLHAGLTEGLRRYNYAKFEFINAHSVQVLVNLVVLTEYLVIAGAAPRCKNGK